MSNSKNRDAAIIAEKEILQKVTIAMRSSAGPKRWFWELLQNAVDTISDYDDKKVNIDITFKLNDDGSGATMRFEHDGEPFLESENPNKFDDFKNLILPRSGKKSSDINKVGKFGTGFLSTHNLSLKIDVEGVYQSLSGDKFEINTQLDRTYFMDEDDRFDGERIKSITDGLDRYDESLEAKIKTDKSKTSFLYQLNDANSIEKVKTGLKDIDQSLPIVFVLNSKIESVRIQNLVSAQDYTYTPADLKVFDGFSIQNCQKRGIGLHEISSVVFKSSGSVTLCWPVEAFESGPLKFKNSITDYKKLIGDKIPLIYSTFPMIGSNGVKFPMIVHSKSFKPNEKRDGVSLTDEQYTDDVTREAILLDTSNKLIMEEAVGLYRNFLEAVSSTAENLFYITKIVNIPQVEWISKNWYKDKISSPLACAVASAKIIDVSDNKIERKSILDEEGKIQIFFPSVSIGEAGENRERQNEIFYGFCRDFFTDKIPVQKDLKHWHEILWSDENVIKILEIEDLFSAISKECTSLRTLSEKLEMDREKTFTWLNEIYKLVDDTASNDLFDKYAIIPNQKGDFKLAKDLKIESPESMIDPNIICILRNLDPEKDWFKILIHRKITNCKYDFDSYKMEDASHKINELLLSPKDYNELLNIKSIEKILQRLLSFQSDTETGNNLKKQTLAYSQDIFNEISKKTIPFFNDFKIDNTIKHMIRLINNKIAETQNISGLSSLLGKEKNETIIWLNDYLNFQDKKDFEALMHWNNIIPNQYGDFCAHGEEGDKERMYRPYGFNNGLYAEHIALPKQLIKNLLFFDKSQDWNSFLLLDGIKLATLPAKSMFELAAAIDGCVLDISKRILSDSEQHKEVYRNDLLELLQWWDSNKSWERYFKELPYHADKLYSLISFSKDLVDILKNKEKFGLAKKINNSNLSAATIEKTINKIEDMQSQLGERGVEEFLRKAEIFMEKKEVFNKRLQIGQNIEQLLKTGLASENLDIIPDNSNSGSFDIGIFRKSDPTRVLKLEVKSYKFGTDLPFSFSPTQVMESENDASNYIVCTLQRPLNEDASIEYIKSNLTIHTSLSRLTEIHNEKIRTFYNIYQESKTGKIPLEIPCITDPRVKIPFDELSQSGKHYSELLEIIKNKFST